ncbi:MAG TPA: hypothetical protein VFP65_19840 [Anaeromyxobacteraceae bacterium]|nr:hypothetical protein [Anaeromyxobacteraceae bacterium]
MAAPSVFNLASPGPDDLPADSETGSDPLMDALEQMRSLCDQIEAEQMKGRKDAASKPASPASPEDTDDAAH